MAAQALYLKYRPQTFDEVAGQDAITQTLRNALRQEKIRHAYLLTGPRGTGKTTTARLLAKAVNCTAEAVEERPCNQCSTCVAINEGRLLDLIEIDAASNRGIDEIRDIREKVGFRPNEGRYKVYVLDEAHMLTEPAFNALLKTLEEPPPHVIFTLVTTDPHKIPATITSRCQRFDFRRISVEAVTGRLAYIAECEGLEVEPDALRFIAHQGTGAMRDAISLLDQLTSYGREITLAQVQEVLGTVASEAAGKLAACLVEGDVSGGLELINRAVNDGADPRQFGREVVEYLRGLLLIREGAGTRTLNLTAEQDAEMTALAERIPVDRLLQSIRLFNEAATDLRRGLQTIPQLPLELALVEVSLESEAPGTTAQPVHQEQVVYRASSGAATKPDPAKPEADVPQTPERATTPVVQAPASEVPAKAAPANTGPASPQATATPAAAGAPADDPAATTTEAPPATAQAPSGGAEAQTPHVNLAQVEGSWGQILHAVRQRNPLVEGALRTNCKPVEVYGDEIVIAFPYPFLRDKLGDPRRRAEIQDALAEVLGGSYRLKLVMESEHTSRPQTATPGPNSNPATPYPAGSRGPETQGSSPAEEASPTGEPSAAAPSPANPSPGEGAQEAQPPNPSPDAQAAADEVPKEISDWAEDHGAEARIIPK
jgi:DNA polymerase-3 subunit gamma/tau